jgi:hypothetical protein
MQLPPIVLPEPCLSEPLDPKDFELAVGGFSTSGEGSVVKGRTAADRARERPLSFDPAKAPWRINRGTSVLPRA